MTRRFFLSAGACLLGGGFSLHAADDPIGRKRLVGAYVFLSNAVLLVKGGSVAPRPRLEKAAEALGNRELRLEIGQMADTVEKSFSQLNNEPQSIAVTTRVRAARITLTTWRDVDLENVHNLEMERRKNPKRDSPASYLRREVESIHQALNAQ